MLSLLRKRFYDDIGKLEKENDFAKEFELTKAIKAELAQTVMDYMIPQRFVYVKELPRTANGKIDRKGLMNEVNT